ncbi:hypothetical protein ACH5RR_002792 [Cinchona calisaya]|uniref:Uncharacterized protein n=1 Tax=Cinchona calisaya TaxID=153742 RepID=A0ABD3AT02_9GENT
MQTSSQILEANSQAIVKLEALIGQLPPSFQTGGQVDSRVSQRNGVMQISFGNMKAELNIFDICRQPADLDNVNEVNLIDSSTHNTFLQSHSDDSPKACLTYFGCDVDIDKPIDEVNTLL